MSERMDKFFDDLHVAEFGYTREEYETGTLPLISESNPRDMVDLLKRAQDWSTHINLVKVCTYLGAECDDRIDTVEGCKEIIQEDIEYWKGEIHKSLLDSYSDRL